MGRDQPSSWLNSVVGDMQTIPTYKVDRKGCFPEKPIWEAAAAAGQPLLGGKQQQEAQGKLQPVAPEQETD